MKWFRRSVLTAAGVLASAAPAVAVAAPRVIAAGYLGGSSDDEATSAAISSDGSLLIAGKTSSSALAGQALTALEGSGGFVLRLDATGQHVLAAGSVPPVLKMLVRGDDSVLLMTERKLYLLSSDLSSVMWSSPELGGLSNVAWAPDGELLALAGGKLQRLSADGQTIRFAKDVGRGQLRGLAVNPQTGATYVSGDTNTNTGFEPYRSPFIFEYDQNGEKVSKLYDWAGPDVRAQGRMLQADSSVKALSFDESGALWMIGWSDGGNTVLTRGARDLDVEQAALKGACYPNACFGYQGAKSTGMFGRLNSTVSDLERASWIVPYFWIEAQHELTPACGCQGGARHPNSVSIEGVARAGSQVIAWGGSTTRHPTTDNAWYSQALSQKGMGLAFVSVFDEQLSKMTMSTMLPGTQNGYGSYRGGRLLVTGSAFDPASITASAEQAAYIKAVPATPADSTVPAQFAGGAKDAYFYLACMTDDSECSAAPGPAPSGSGGKPSGAGSAGRDPSVGGQASPTGGAPAAAGGSGPGAGTDGLGEAPGAGGADDDGGCGCKLQSQRGSRSSVLLAALAAAVLTVSRRRQRHHHGGK